MNKKNNLKVRRYSADLMRRDRGFTFNIHAKVQTMIKVGLIAISLILMTACGDSEPVATSYKKSMTAPATGTVVTPGTGDATALKAQGTTIYNAKCATCHEPIETSKKRGATEARITASATISFHSTVNPFPTATEIKALEAALK